MPLSACLVLCVALIPYFLHAAEPPTASGNSHRIGALINDSVSLGSRERGFAWGAELGSSIDMTSNNLTTFDAVLYAGYRCPYLDFVGAGAGVQRAFGSGNTLVPLFVNIISSFRPRPGRFFMNLRSGYSFNTISDADTRGGFLLSVGGGVYLVRTARLRSFIALTYGYYHLNRRQVNDLQMNIKHVDYAQLSIGINF